MKRIIAFVIVIIPILFAIFGVKIMRDTLFQIYQWPFTSLSLQFISGLVFFLGGLGLIGGFIYRRDKKRHKVTKGLRKNRKLSS